MICPKCNGKKKLVCTFPPKLIACYQCEGSGEVPEEMSEWIDKGKIIKEKRISKRMSHREASMKLGVDGHMLSKMETGRIEPDMSIYDNL